MKASVGEGKYLTKQIQFECILKSYRLLEFSGQFLDDGPHFAERHVGVGVVVVAAAVVVQQSCTQTCERCLTRR